MHVDVFGSIVLDFKILDEWLAVCASICIDPASIYLASSLSFLISSLLYLLAFCFSFLSTVKYYFLQLTLNLAVLSLEN